MQGTAVKLMSVYLLEIIAIMLVAGMIFSKISNIIKIPDVVLYILASVILGPQLLGWVNVENYEIVNQLILTFGAAYILYDGGREVKLKILNKVKFSVLLLATLGVAITTAIIGFSSSKIFGIDIMTALLLGSVIASTDPTVLIPLFKKVRINEKLKQTIISESAFNDAAGAIITFSIIGIIVGYISSYLVSDKNHALLKEYSAEASVATVIIAYILSNKLGFSGFMSVFIVGMLCGNKKIFNFYLQEDYFITQYRFREVITIIFRMMIFILLGTHLDFAVIGKYIGSTYKVP